jgi:hypothetical protein
MYAYDKSAPLLTALHTARIIILPEVSLPITGLPMDNARHNITPTWSECYILIVCVISIHTVSGEVSEGVKERYISFHHLLIRAGPRTTCHST